MRLAPLHNVNGGGIQNLLFLVNSLLIRGDGHLQSFSAEILICRKRLKTQVRKGQDGGGRKDNVHAQYGTENGSQF